MRRWVFHDPRDQRNILKNVQIEQTGFQQGTVRREGTEVDKQSVGKCRFIQEKPTSAWCGLLVSNQHLPSGRISHEHLL